MTGPVAVGNIVSEFSIGATHIRICDDFCRDKTSDDIAVTLGRISRIALEDFRAAAAIAHSAIGT